MERLSHGFTAAVSHGMPHDCSDALFLSACEAMSSQPPVCGLAPAPVVTAFWTADDWRRLTNTSFNGTQRLPVLSWSGLRRWLHGHCRTLERAAPNLRFSRVRATAVRGLPADAFDEKDPTRQTVSSAAPLQTRQGRLAEEEDSALDLELLVHVMAPAVVSSIRASNFGSGVVYASSPALVLDLSGGCCRPAPTSCWPAQDGEPTLRPSCTHDAAACESGWWGCQLGHTYARAAALDAWRGVASRAEVAVHEWLYVALHVHSATYYHTMGQALPRLMWVRSRRSNAMASRPRALG